MLSDVDIYSYMESGDIEIFPFDIDRLQANSYDLAMKGQILNELGEESGENDYEATS